MKLLSISIDRKMFEEGSAVRARMAELARTMDELHVIVAADTRFKEGSFASNGWLYPTRTSWKPMYGLDAAKIGRFIIERRGITHITCQDPFLTAMAGVSLKKRYGLPLEIQVHTDIGSPNFTYTFGNRVRKAMALSYLPKADHVRVVSERIKKYLVEELSIPAEKIEVRPIAVSTEGIKNAPVTADLHKKYPQFEKVALMASRLTPEKNIEAALEAWPQVSAQLPKAGLIIVGSGPRLASLRALATKLGISGSVAFESWVDQPTIASYYKTADLFLNTSLFEGYGMTLVEARAAGCPIVSTDVGVARECGARIVSWDPADIARGITESFSV
jgi:glycosyltransferase involved in cell wall biosynthesis